MYGYYQSLLGVTERVNKKYMPIESNYIHYQVLILKNNHICLQFADMLQRIECYKDMFLSQTQLLTLQPLAALTKEFEKAKVG